MLSSNKVIGDRYYAKWNIQTGFKKKLAFNQEETQLVCVTMDGYYHKMAINNAGDNPSSISDDTFLSKNVPT